MKQRTPLNALVGAAATVLLAFIPLSPLLGGGLAGYLEGRDAPETSLGSGALVGALSGVIATIPLAILGALFVGVFTLVPVQVPMEASLVGLLVLVVVAFLSVLYFVGFSVIGGILGVYVATELEL